MKSAGRKRERGLCVLFLLLFTAVFFTACGEAEPRRVKQEENAVASVTVFASSGDGERVFGLFNFGHAFLLLTNESDGTIDLCGYPLKAGESATISTWSVT